MSAPTLQELHVYPLKSAQGIAHQRVRLAANGFSWDRHWMVVRPDGLFVTQRTHPNLARIATELTPDGLLLTSEGRPALRLPFEPPPDTVPVRIWRDACLGLDAGAASAAWVSELLGEPLRVVCAPANPQRQADPRYAGSAPAPLAFPDGFPLLICNRASLDALNERLGATLPIDRFRPNLVLSGLAPFAEDRIDTIRIGPVRLRLVKPCTRCVIPSRDQRTGRPDIDPMPVLRSFRFDPLLRGVTFGMNALVSAGAGESLERGSACEVTFRE